MCRDYIVQCCDGSRSVLAAAGEGPEMQEMQEIVFVPSYSAYKQYYTGPFLKSLTQPETHLLHLLRPTIFQKMYAGGLPAHLEKPLGINASMHAPVSYFVALAPMTTDSTWTLLRRQHCGRRLPWETKRHDRFAPATDQPSSLHTKIQTLLASRMQPNR